MLAFYRKLLLSGVLTFVVFFAAFSQSIRPYTQVFSQNLKGGTAIFGNTAMHALTGGLPNLAVMNESGTANSAGGIGYSNYGNDDESMQPAMIDAAVPALTIFANGSSWKYNNPNTNQGTAWRTLSTPPAANWVSGTGSFGYNTTETVAIPVGNVTNYFLKTVTISNLALYANFMCWLSYDDGAVVYVNGVEVKRLNMPTGAITYTTLASLANNSINQAFTIPVSAFVNGTNVIAVEVHQRNTNNPGDCLFDMSLQANPFVPSGATSADLTLPAGTNVIKFARLYWGGRVDNSTIAAGTDTLRKIKLRKGSSGAYTDFIASATSTDQYAASVFDVLYQSYVDIAPFIQANGGGTYTVANIPCTPGFSYTLGGQYAGWCIMIAYENLSQPYNSVRIYDGFSQVYDAGVPVTSTVTLTGLNVPNNPLSLSDAVMSTMVWEGDASLGASLGNPAGDFVKVNNITVSNAVNPAANFWNGTVSKNGAFVTGKNPNYTNQMGIDIDELQVGTGYGILPNATSVTVQFGTEADQYFPSIFGFSIRMKDPVITLNKAVNDASGNGTLESNEILTYTLSGTNTGPGAAYNTFVIDSLPVNVTYVAGSLKIINAPGITTATAQTDAEGDDFAFKANAGTRNYVKFYLGAGSTPTAGGTMAAITTYSLQFKVKGGLIPGSVTNTARITSNSQAGDIFNDDGTAIIGPAAAPVPVTLLAFTASLQKANESHLNWTTENELNNDHFEVERSEDGVHFIYVGSVHGNGSSATTHYYNLSDKINTAATVVYYRLKIVDTDGAFAYSKIIALRLRGTSGDSFTIYPNPLNDNIKISLTVDADANANVRIISLEGKEMLSRRITLQAGGNIVILNDLGGLSHGTYILEINTGIEVLIKKIVKN